MDFVNCTRDYWLENELECENNLNNNWDSIVLLNANNVQNLSNNTLVRFRGMIQDMYDLEYYYEKYQVINECSKDTSIRCGKYQDAVILKDKEIIDAESKHNVTSDRHTFVGITVPGLNPWAIDVEKEKFKMHIPTMQNCNTKRPLEEDAMEVETELPTNMCNKKMCTNNLAQGQQSSAGQSVLSKDYILNLPISDQNAFACLLKIYKDANAICLNEIYEFVGFLSVDPISYLNETDYNEIDLEIQMHNPPSSLIPRLHCVSWKKMVHNNPLVSVVNNYANDKEKMKRISKELHMILTQLLLGDAFAAHYTIYYLLSEIYLRRNTMALGKFSLNISNTPNEIRNYGEQLYKFLEMFLVKSHYLPMTLDNMNSLTFIPKKDYECNRLTSGLLQLSKNTHLIVDETKLTVGKLNEAGVKSVSAIIDVIKNQSIKYDFQYYQMDYDCDIPILILSEGKTMLSSDYHLKLQPYEVYVNTFEDVLTAVGTLLNPELLNDIRIYLTSAKFINYYINDKVQEMVQADFVKLRQVDKLSETELHQLLVLARLICLSEGETNLNENCWKKAVEFEKQRKLRLI